MWPATAGHRGPGQSVRASVLLSRVLTEAGVTPAVHLRGPAPLAASPTQPVRESGKVLEKKGEREKKKGGRKKGRERKQKGGRKKKGRGEDGRRGKMGGRKREGWRKKKGRK